MIFSVCYFVVGFLISFLTTPWVIRLARTGVGLDHANESRKTHVGAIPRLGGMPIMLAISVGLLVILTAYPENATQWFPVLLGAC
jgi:UDP-GlcNAc:undecaprenyl-phosphate GlcNAc-1-phosphate transferase